MKLGDKYIWRPTTDDGHKSASQGNRRAPEDKSRQVTGRIIYIHPQHRFFAAEALFTHGRLREAILFAERE